MGKAKHVVPLPDGHRRDDEGAYFVTCAYGWHPGLPRNPDECLMRQCSHLRKVYFSRPYTLTIKEDSILYEHPMCHDLSYEI